MPRRWRGRYAVRESVIAIKGRLWPLLAGEARPLAGLLCPAAGALITGPLTEPELQTVRRFLAWSPGPSLAVVLALASGTLAAADGVQFKDPLNDEPLAIPLPDDASEAVRQFHATGENPYMGEAEAITEGEEIYSRWCVACHLPDGTGRIGPSLVDDKARYARTGTAKGKFEIIYAGGAGAMQAFDTRLSQDEILEVIAYLDELQRQQQE